LYGLSGAGIPGERDSLIPPPRRYVSFAQLRKRDKRAGWKDRSTGSRGDNSRSGITIRLLDNRPTFDMKKPKRISIIFFAAIFMSSIGALLYAQKSAQEIALIKINKKYERRTVIKKSTIPHAGNGLFAEVKIKEGEVIGELGGRFVSDYDYPKGNHYIASIPECAWEKTHPYKQIDSKDYGGNVSRINFAPREINGIETNLQNAAIKQLCEDPYFIFVALKDIEAGAEIWSSYGPYYDYDKFMLVPEVRDFFCGLIKLDCSDEFDYSH
jgi:hypothetical protein